MMRIDKIQGIGPIYRRKLEAAGIPSVQALLAQCGEPSARRMIAASTGIAESKLLRWVNIADLMRLDGVGEEYSQLLEAAGVDTVRELKRRQPEILHARLAEVNREKRLARRAPDLRDVHLWVVAANDMEPRVFH